MCGGAWGLASPWLLGVLRPAALCTFQEVLRMLGIDGSTTDVEQALAIFKIPLPWQISHEEWLMAG
jgi:hypothetical protein